MRILMAEVYDEILEETSVKLVAERNCKQFFGKLFFEPVAEKIQKELKVVKLPETADSKLVVDTAYGLITEFGQLAKDGKTYSTMAHWVYMNNLISEYINN